MRLVVWCFDACAVMCDFVRGKSVLAVISRILICGFGGM